MTSVDLQNIITQEKFWLKDRELETKMLVYGGTLLRMVRYKAKAIMSTAKKTDCGHPIFLPARYRPKDPT